MGGGVDCKRTRNWPYFGSVLIAELWQKCGLHSEEEEKCASRRATGRMCHGVLFYNISEQDWVCGILC